LYHLVFSKVLKFRPAIGGPVGWAICPHLAG
jgi:hypothetical protein